MLRIAVTLSLDCADSYAVEGKIRFLIDFVTACCFFLSGFFYLLSGSEPFASAWIHRCHDMTFLLC